MHIKIISLQIFFCCLYNSAAAQQSTPYIRIANITVDTTVLSEYLIFLREGIEAAIKKEPGVVSMFAVADKEYPNRITLLETYASIAAYEQHIETAHFKKYKTGTMKMVQSLALKDVTPIAFHSKTP